MPDAILAVIVLLPLIVAYVLKSNAALGFLALCTGYSVQSLAAGDIKNFLNVTASTFITTDTVNLLLILLPLFITLLLCRGPSSRKLTSPKVFLNLITALASGAAFSIMGVPYFNYIGSTNLTDSQIWKLLSRAQSEIIGLGALLALILIWLNHRKGSAKHHK